MATTKKRKKQTPEEVIQGIIGDIVVESEYKTAATLSDSENAEFESLVDILEGKRNEKDYEWMSDYSIPELISILLTDASGWASVMFQTRDFCEVRLDGEGDEEKNKVRSVKKCLNKTLNIRDIYYYPKYMRLRLINALLGRCYVLCWWEQELREDEVQLMTARTEMKDVLNPQTGQMEQKPFVVREPKKVKVTHPIIDHFNFEVIEPRNVFTDTRYCYSSQHKDWITIRADTSYEKLKKDETKNRYFNLDKVKEAAQNLNRASNTAKETYAKNTDGEINKTPVMYFDVLDRYGKFSALVQERDGEGNPTRITPGIDEQGMPIDGAELVETIITFVLVGDAKIMIRFEPTPFIDSQGKPYKPISRGWCYIHPTKDSGLSDGKYLHQLQVALDDSYNMTSDRVKLATLPTFIGNKLALDDNSSVYIEPEHVIEVNDINNDLRELKISADVTGAMAQIGMLSGKMQQVSSVYPTTMGQLPEQSSTTATAVAGAETRTNARQNYKSMTFEYTFLQEFYWMILQMTYRFMHNDTILKMLGPDARYFDANADYSYSPVTSAIETEFKKEKKIALYDQTVGRISGMIQQLPNVVPIIAHILGRQLVLQGDEFADIGHLIDNLAKSKPVPDEKGGEQVKDMQAPVVSNQNNVPMLTQEKSARGAMSQGAIM